MRESDESQPKKRGFDSGVGRADEDAAAGVGGGLDDDEAAVGRGAVIAGDVASCGKLGLLGDRVVLGSCPSRLLRVGSCRVWAWSRLRTKVDPGWGGPTLGTAAEPELLWAAARRPDPPCHRILLSSSPISSRSRSCSPPPSPPIRPIPLQGECAHRPATPGPATSRLRARHSARRRQRADERALDPPCSSSSARTRLVLAQRSTIR